MRHRQRRHRHHHRLRHRLHRHPRGRHRGVPPLRARGPVRTDRRPTVARRRRPGRRGPRRRPQRPHPARRARRSRQQLRLPRAARRALGGTATARRLRAERPVVHDSPRAPSTHRPTGDGGEGGPGATRRSRRPSLAARAGRSSSQSSSWPLGRSRPDPRRSRRRSGNGSPWAVRVGERRRGTGAPDRQRLRRPSRRRPSRVTRAPAA
jgi:hypothetical protein